MAETIAERLARLHDHVGPPQTPQDTADALHARLEHQAADNRALGPTGSVAADDEPPEAVAKREWDPDPWGAFR